MTEATDKQRKYLASLIMKSKCSHDTSLLLDQAAQDLGYEEWTDAPLTKRLASCLIDIYLGKADIGLYVWAVRKDAELAA